MSYTDEDVYYSDEMIDDVVRDYVETTFGTADDAARYVVGMMMRDHAEAYLEKYWTERREQSSGVESFTTADVNEDVVEEAENDHFTNVREKLEDYYFD